MEEGFRLNQISIRIENENMMQEVLSSRTLVYNGPGSGPGE
jgi:hypothetical protein